MQLEVVDVRRINVFCIGSVFVCSHGLVFSMLSEFRRMDDISSLFIISIRYRVT